jgi:hypothetical protein
MSDATAPDDDKPIPTKRKACTLAVVTIERLEKLRGTHGTTIAGVMTSLIESGVRQAMRDGFLPRPENE